MAETFKLRKTSSDTTDKGREKAYRKQLNSGLSREVNRSMKTHRENLTLLGGGRGLERFEGEVF